VVTRRGYAYAADEDENKLYKIDPSKRFSFAFDDDTVAPSYIDFDFENNLYVIDNVNRLTKYDPDGLILEQKTLSETITALHVASSIIYVATTTSIRTYDFSLTIVDGVATTNEYSGITRAGDYIYLTDMTNDAVEIRNASTLAYVDSFGTTGSGNDNFNAPYDIIYLPYDNSLLISDTGNDRLKKHTPTGDFIVEVAVANCGNISMDYLNNVYIGSSDAATTTIRTFKENFAFAEDASLGADVLSVCFDSTTGYLYTKTADSVLVYSYASGVFTLHQTIGSVDGTMLRINETSQYLYVRDGWVITKYSISIDGSDVITLTYEGDITLPLESIYEGYISTDMKYNGSFGDFLVHPTTGDIYFNYIVGASYEGGKYFFNYFHLLIYSEDLVAKTWEDVGYISGELFAGYSASDINSTYNMALINNSICFACKTQNRWGFDSSSISEFNLDIGIATAYTLPTRNITGLYSTSYGLMYLWRDVYYSGSIRFDSQTSVAIFPNTSVYSVMPALAKPKEMIVIEGVLYFLVNDNLYAFDTLSNVETLPSPLTNVCLTPEPIYSLEQSEYYYKKVVGGPTVMKRGVPPMYSDGGRLTSSLSLDLGGINVNTGYMTLELAITNPQNIKTYNEDPFKYNKISIFSGTGELRYIDYTSKLTTSENMTKVFIKLSDFENINSFQFSNYTKFEIGFRLVDNYQETSVTVNNVQLIDVNDFNNNSGIILLREPTESIDIYPYIKSGINKFRVMQPAAGGDRCNVTLVANLTKFGD
jgi:hypothetical protein